VAVAASSSEHDKSRQHECLLATCTAFSYQFEQRLLRVCRLWNVFTAQNALVCRTYAGMLAACDLTPAGASTIFTCDMRLTAVSSRASTYILHTSLFRTVSSGWSISSSFSSSSLYSFNSQPPLIDISFLPSHSLHSLAVFRAAAHNAKCSQ
jgi:hypothetical protein